VWNACAVPALERIVVVLGAHAAQIRARVDFLDAEPLDCPEWERGQSASLRCGLEALAGTRRVLVLLGDEPLVTPQVIARFVDERPGSRAAYDGRPGHPAVLGPELQAAARSLRGDHGLRDVARWRLVECGHLASGADVDTPEDLEALRRAAGRPSRSRAGGR
jgi:CTP:molybdopterin cytidylyltransferase MocA